MGKAKAEHNQHKKRLKELQQKTLKKVDYHLQKTLVDSQDFYDIVREFFLQLIEKEYEATYEEIVTEIDKLEHEFISFSDAEKHQIRQLLEYLSTHEYHAPDGHTQEQIKQLLLQFRNLMAKLTTLRENTVEIEIRHGRQLLEERKFSDAEKAYKSAVQTYNALPQDEQKKHYQSLHTLFLALQEQKKKK